MAFSHQSQIQIQGNQRGLANKIGFHRAFPQTRDVWEQKDWAVSRTQNCWRSIEGSAAWGLLWQHKKAIWELGCNWCCQLTRDEDLWENVPLRLPISLYSHIWPLDIILVHYSLPGIFIRGMPITDRPCASSRMAIHYRGADFRMLVHVFSYETTLPAKIDCDQNRSRKRQGLGILKLQVSHCLYSKWQDLCSIFGFLMPDPAGWVMMVWPEDGLIIAGICQHCGECQEHSICHEATKNWTMDPRSEASEWFKSDPSHSICFMWMRIRCHADCVTVPLWSKSDSVQATRYEWGNCQDECHVVTGPNKKYLFVDGLLDLLITSHNLSQDDWSWTLFHCTDQSDGCWTLGTTMHHHTYRGRQAWDEPATNPTALFLNIWLFILNWISTCRYILSMGYWRLTIDYIENVPSVFAMSCQECRSGTWARLKIHNARRWPASDTRRETITGGYGAT